MIEWIENTCLHLNVLEEANKNLRYGSVQVNSMGVYFFNSLSTKYVVSYILNSSYQLQCFGYERLKLIIIDNK